MMRVVERNLDSVENEKKPAEQFVSEVNPGLDVTSSETMN
jgi:hypothetical protein